MFMLHEPARGRRIAGSLVLVSAFCSEGTNVTLLRRGPAQQTRRVITRLTPIGEPCKRECHILRGSLLPGSDRAVQVVDVPCCGGIT